MRALLFVGVSLVASALALSAQTPMPPAEIVSSQRLRQLGDSLTPGASRTARLGKGPGFTYGITHRDSTGGLERHDAWTDVFIVESGSATLLTGGVQVGATESTPGEWRGGTARGAVRAALHAGDIATIPAGTPHQMILAPGERITYVAVKVAAPAGEKTSGRP
jgi:mannose-6-phosphate isomerase-like protein (cupin superfamily)